MTRNTFEAKGGVAPDNEQTALKALAWDTMYASHQPSDDYEDTQEDYDLREEMEVCLMSCITSGCGCFFAERPCLCVDSQSELKENNVEITVEGGMVVEVDGLPVDWTFEITDKDCEFEGLE
tara:strand:- start:58 stop:423 length:366 start_codon:yes stop_codon:yes gene_type:complete